MAETAHPDMPFAKSAYERTLAHSERIFETLARVHSGLQTLADLEAIENALPPGKYWDTRAIFENRTGWFEIDVEKVGWYPIPGNAWRPVAFVTVHAPTRVFAMARPLFAHTPNGDAMLSAFVVEGIWKGPRLVRDDGSSERKRQVDDLIRKLIR